MIRVFAVGRPELPPYQMPDRFRTDIAYFMTPAGEHGVVKLPQHEYWVRLADAEAWYADGAVPVVSPLDSENSTEFELTEEQEAWLQWMITNKVEHVKLG